MLLCRVRGVGIKSGVSGVDSGGRVCWPIIEKGRQEKVVRTPTCTVGALLKAPPLYQP